MSLVDVPKLKRINVIGKARKRVYQNGMTKFASVQHATITTQIRESRYCNTAVPVSTASGQTLLQHAVPAACLHTAKPRNLCSFLLKVA